MRDEDREPPEVERTPRRNADERVATMVLSLVGNNFVIDTMRTGAGYVLAECYRKDEFGVPTSYVFVLPQDELGNAATTAINRRAAQLGAHAVVIGDEIPQGMTGLDWPAFQARLGGPIDSWLPFQETFPDEIDILGHNQAVPDLEGRPDELFERYVYIGLRFLLSNKVVRYGQNRMGEPLPDGVSLPADGPVVLYDAKAARAGYEMTRDSVRQFCDYVRDFRKRYEAYVGPVHAFLVVSGHFEGEDASLRERSDQLYSDCGTRLVFMTARDLGEATHLVAACPSYRQSIDWRQIFSRRFESRNDVQRALGAAVRDGVIGGK